MNMYAYPHIIIGLVQNMSVIEISTKHAFIEIGPRILHPPPPHINMKTLQKTFQNIPIRWFGSTENPFE